MIDLDKNTQLAFKSLPLNRVKERAMKLSCLARNLTLASIIPLVGCGGEEASNIAPPPSPEPFITAISDLITTSENGQTKHIPVYQ